MTPNSFDSSSSSTEIEELSARFAAEGLSLLGITAADAMPGEDARYLRWIEKGHHGSMTFLKDHWRGKYDPSAIVPRARSILFAGMNYFQDRVGGYSVHRRPDREEPTALVARYAWGRDYHKELGARLRRIATSLAEDYPGDTFRSFTDATPLDERYYGQRAGVGSIGRNTLLINGELGSWFFLGEIVATRPFPPHTSSATGVVACPTRCSRCIDVCPTGALIAPYTFDAGRCISYLTIEHKGVIPIELRPSIGRWVFGCDLCQEVCPLNSGVQPTTVPNFLRPIAGERVVLREILRIRSHQEFTASFAGSPLMRAGWKMMIRNAAIVAANTGSVDLIPDLKAARGVADPIVSEHIEWAIDTLSRVANR